VTAELELLRAENAQLNSKSKGGLTLKVSEKGGISLYGMGRFPSEFVSVGYSGDHKRACRANAKLAWIPDYLEMKNEFIAQSDGAGLGSEGRTANYQIEELR
jgi:hypothetical protein